MGYSIGKISKITGLSPEMIRYYELQGVVKPLRNKNSTYREYSDQDVFHLADCQLYRNLGFSISESAEISHKKSLEEILSMLDRKNREIQQEIDQSVLRRNCLEELQSDLELCRYNLGNYWFVSMPEMKIRISTSSITEQTIYEQRAYDMQHLAWYQSMPFAMPMQFVADINSMREPDKDCSCYGLAIESEMARRLELPTDAFVRTLTASLCLVTVVDALNHDSFTYAQLKDGLKYLKERGYRTRNTVMGIILVRFHNEEGHHRYYKLLIPVEKSA